MSRNFLLLPLGVSLLLVPFAGTVYSENPQKDEKVLQIPIRVTQRVFIPKPREEVPQKLPAKVEFEINARKVGLVYPTEIYVPKEHVKVEKHFFSCGEPTDKELYAKGVEAFNKGKLREAEHYFLELLYRNPQSPYAIKAKYYLGVIAFEQRQYQKTYRIFKNLCSLPYNFDWKKFACYNAVISGLYIGVHDYRSASSNVFWKNYLLWLDGKIDDYTFRSKLNRKQLEEPYRNYCHYLRVFLNPNLEVGNLPPYYKRSLELRRLLLGFVSGTVVSPQGVEKFINDPLYGKDFEYFYTYYLINAGYHQRAFQYIKDLLRKDYKKALKLARLLGYVDPKWLPKLLELFPNDGKLWELYAVNLYNSGKLKRALDIAEKLGLYRIAGYAAYRLGDYKTAVENLLKVKDKNRTDYGILLDSLIRTGDWKGFLKVLSEVRNKYPDLYREYLGWYYYYKGDWSKAAALLAEPLYKAVAYFNLGAYQKAAAVLNRLHGAEAKILEAKALIASGNFDKAIEALRGINSAEANYLKGVAYFAKGDYREAAYYFSKLLPYYRKFPDVFIRLADAYYNLGNYRLAEAYYFRYIKHFPKGEWVKDAYLGLVNVYLQTGDPTVANYVYRALEKYPSLVGEEVKLKLAEAFVQNGELQKAKKLLTELVKSKDDYIRGKALLLMAKVDPQRAEEYLKQALEVDFPEIKSQAVLELAKLYLKEGKKDKAIQFLELHEGDVLDMDKLVDLYTQLGDFKRLYYLLQELIAAANKYTETAFQIAEKYHRPEFYKLAVYSLDPKIAATSAYRLELYYLKKGDLKNALKYALFLKVRKLKYEPIYTEAMFQAVKTLHEKGYIADACKLIGEINPKYLTVEQKLEYESIKVDCSK